MNRSASSFRRGPPKYDEQPRCLVLCEDTKSSLIYLGDAARHFRAHAKVEVANCGRTDPQGIVAEAIRRQQKYDQVFCVIDRDGHPKFDEALQLCAQHASVKVIASYPCYEYWILLHFRATRKPYVATAKDSSADLLLKDLMKEPGMGDYSKGKSIGLFQKLLDKLPEAIRHAHQITMAVNGDGEPNPSTKIHELLEILEKLGEPMKIPGRN